MRRDRGCPPASGDAGGASAGDCRRCVRHARGDIGCCGRARRAHSVTGLGIVISSGPVHADRRELGRSARHHRALMAPTPQPRPTPLPRLTLSQIAAWDIDHLDDAASSWRPTARRWQDGFSAVNTGIIRPGGTEWTGASADAASARTDRDRICVAGLAERLNSAAAVARTGAAEISAAKSSAIASVENAHRAGFVVAEDRSVRDSLAVQSKPIRLIRDLQAKVFAADLKAQSLQLAAADQAVASKLNAFTAGVGDCRLSAEPVTAARATQDSDAALRARGMGRMRARR